MQLQPIRQPKADVTQYTVSDRVKELLQPCVSESTRREYEKAWKYFTAWCEREGFTPLPATPNTVCEYIAYLGKHLKFNTITKRITAIGQVHVYADQENPRESKYVRRALKNLKRNKRKKDGERVTKKAPLLKKHIKKIIGQLDGSVSGLRDKALLLIGYTGAFRRSELTALKYEDLRFTDRGIEVYLPTSKTDQEGEGDYVCISYGKDPEICPVNALQSWIQEAGIETGPVFRRVDRHGNVYQQGISTNSVALRVKKHIKAIGLDPAEYSGHSMRAGMATQCAIERVDSLAAMRHGRWKQMETYKGYQRLANKWQDNVTAELV